MERKTSIRPSEQDTQFKDDPRIDSPEIVVRPAQTKEIPVLERIEQVIEPPVDTSQEEQDHECEVGFQDALKQNILPILGMLFGVFLLGYLLGKK